MRLRRIAEDRCHQVQRGLVRGRQFTTHIAELGTYARMAGGHTFAEYLTPVFVAFDVCAAFPSMSWE
eukprot:532946-Pyramimonas_sp.AAC.1